MLRPIDWKDEPFYSRERIVRTDKELLIPGLRMFGKHTMTHAAPPLAPHFHRDAYEFTFVTNGAISFTIGQTSYELSGYDVFMTRPGEVHSTDLLPLPAGEILWFQIDVSIEQTGEFLFLSQEARRAFLLMLEQLPGPVISGCGNRVLSLLKRAYELSADPALRYQCASYLTLTLYELAAASSRHARSISPDMEAVVRHIDAHITEELPLEELAGLCSLSVSQFKQKFKAQVGSAPRHYVNYKKIQAAKKLLSDGVPVTDAAMALGFNSSSYFTVVFKRYNACSPSEYVNTMKH